MCPSNTPSCPDSREALIEAALACFAKYGYDATSTRLVASMAGKNSSLISYYFKGKEGLYREVFRYLLTHFAAKTQDEGAQDADQAGPNPADPEEGRARLRAHIRRVLREVDAHFDTSDPLRESASRLWMSEFLAPRHEIRDLLQERIEPFVREARTCIRAIRPDLSPAEVDFWGCAIHGCCIHHASMAEIHQLAWTSADPSLTLDAAADRLADFAFNGLQRR
ncbi:TetR/AcrR family transcriptional regulator [Geothrix fermentans]|uniref:TetR/AcrR family transcriptional regulator n=1 Tax=Geothrix fermentans TaxID=44676 RepID=UPI000A02FBA8|nr:TetR/AcrR family transcriptional regulator [Geothrix fermentans]